MKAVVLIPCIDRHHLLKRTLWTLTRQTVDCDVIVIDDGSRPGLDALVFASGAQYMKLREPLLPGSQDTRGPSHAWRHAFMMTDNPFIILSSPEILVPLDAVERMLDAHRSPRRSTPLLQFINRPLYEKMDTKDWKADVHALQNFPAFRHLYNRWGLYNYQMHEWKHHVCFTGQTRDDWLVHDFMPAGCSDDGWLQPTEAALSKSTGINYHVNQIDLTVYHLFHEVGPQSAMQNDIWYDQNYGPTFFSANPECSLRIARIRKSERKADD